MMETLSVDDIAAFHNGYLQLSQERESQPSAGLMDLMALEEEWRQRTPHSKLLAQVVIISNKSADPRGYWYSLMRENGYTRYGYPFQSTRKA